MLFNIKKIFNDDMGGEKFAVGTKYYQKNPLFLVVRVIYIFMPPKAIPGFVPGGTSRGMGYGT